MLCKALSLATAWWLNRPYLRRIKRIDPVVLQLHRRLLVADLHTDSLLWARDLLKRGRIGHVDLPRLVEGGVALQVFSVVTKVPKGQNIERNEGSSDYLPLLGDLQGLPDRTRTSLLERALHQAHELERLEQRSGGRLKIVRTKRDLAQVRESRSTSTPLVGALLSLEGAHALEGRLQNLQPLYDAGFRMIAPTHFFDTDIGGSAHGMEKGGLTPLGREWVARMEAMNLMIDLAHASSRTIDDVITLARRTIMVSHTGVIATCNNSRNLPDRHLYAVAQTGGVIGIGFWPDATCGNDVASIIRAIRHAAKIVGADHVALGSDFDGAVRTPIDVSRMPQLTAALLDAGFDENDIGKIMGGNVFRVFAASLPD